MYFVIYFTRSNAFGRSIQHKKIGIPSCVLSWQNLLSTEVSVLLIQSSSFAAEPEGCDYIFICVWEVPFLFSKLFLAYYVGAIRKFSSSENKYEAFWKLLLYYYGFLNGISNARCCIWDRKCLTRIVHPLRVNLGIIKTHKGFENSQHQEVQVVLTMCWNCQ